MVRDAQQLEQQLGVLAGRYADSPCVIVTCGPSLGSVPAEALRRSLDGVLTIVVKQAIDVVGDQADFHCWNSFNVRRFRQRSGDTIRCFVEEPTGRIIQHNRADIRFPLGHSDGDLEHSLAAQHDFAHHVLSSSTPRPFGPGIMYELCFHLALHLGVKRIVTVGWDIASTDGKNTHFYDRPAEQQFFESERTPTQGSAALAPRRKTPEVLRRQVRWARTRRRHRRGEVYNRTRVLPGETEMVAASTRPLADWLSEEGVGLEVATDSSFLDAGIPRIPLDGLVDHLGSLRE